jgi:integrase/recombinase XerD
MESFLDATPQTSTVTVYSRHKRTCPHKADIYFRSGKKVKGKKVEEGCNCPKWLYVYDGKTAQRFSAKTRNWSTAEQFAKEYEVGRTGRPQRKEKPAPVSAVPTSIAIAAALSRWLANHKGLKPGSLSMYTYFTEKMKRWSERRGLVNLDEITGNLLDEWRGTWAADADDADDQIGLTTQSTLLVRLKAFFRWAHGIELIRKNPTVGLKRIKPRYAETQVLTPEQFSQLLDAIDPFCALQRGEVQGFAKEFHALFLLQRVTGLRIIDCLVLPRTALVGDRLFTTTQKTGAEVRRHLPQCVVDALNALPPNREGFRPGYFFWGAGQKQATLSGRWCKILAPINGMLNFVNEKGKPFRFHTHCLRDTFAVELIMDDFKIEQVSKLLTHESLKTTMDHYLPWIRRREVQLEAKLEQHFTGKGMGFAMPPSVAA